MKHRLLLSAALVAASAPARADKADFYALFGSRFLTVSGATLDQATLVIRDGVI